jgi:lipoprotein-releasing system ATP-binding protein
VPEAARPQIANAATPPPAAAAPLLQAERLVKEFRSGDRVLRILKGVDLRIGRGECLAIVGPSGAGKSTLLHALGFLDRPTSGDVVYDGRLRASALGEAAYAEVRNRHIGFVFQFHHLLPDLTALENALVPLMIRHTVGQWARAAGPARTRARELLGRLGLGERLHHRPDQLSGGERQRVAIARALAGDPDALLCDEPTGNLDTATSREIQDLLFGLNRDGGKTLVVVTHDESIARRAHRVIRLVDGKIV